LIDGWGLKLGSRMSGFSVGCHRLFSFCHLCTCKEINCCLNVSYLFVVFGGFGGGSTGLVVAVNLGKRN
jgi:hypothetical protein